LKLPEVVLRERLRQFLEEDLGWGDVTTHAVLGEEDPEVEAWVEVEEEGIFAGAVEARTLAEMVGLRVVELREDGSRVAPGDYVLRMRGRASAVLMVERVLLNVIMRMSGIATLTAAVVDRVREYGCHVAATRKTPPGFAYFAKRGVEIGGGDTHRFHLEDMVLIKKNHVDLVGSVAEAVKRARRRSSFSKRIEVEVRSLEEAVAAARAGADIVMLDNMSPEEVERVITVLKQQGLRERVCIECSGSITLENAVAYARAGADIISLGALTEEAKPLGMRLRVRRI